MVCHNRRCRRQATVQLAPLHSWHRRVHRDRRDYHCRRHHCSHNRYHHSRRRHRRRNHRRSTAVGTTAVGAIAVGTIAVATAVATTAVGTIAAAIAIRVCRDIKATAASRESGEGGSRGGGGGYRGGNDVSVRGRLVSNAVTHPMAVLATVAPDPFESRRCPADPGHVALSPVPFTMGHRAVGRRRRSLLRPPSGVGTAVEWPSKTKTRRQRFWWRTGLLLLLLAVDVMVASTPRPGLLYSMATSTRSTTASPRSSIPSTGGLEPSTSNTRVWVGRHP